MAVQSSDRYISVPNNLWLDTRLTNNFVAINYRTKTPKIGFLLFATADVRLQKQLGD